MHHLLHDHRQGDRGLIHAVAGPIADGACRPEAAEAVDNGGKQIVLAQHVQERVLLAGKGQVRQVLGGGGGAHRHPRSAQVAVGGTDLGCQCRRQGTGTEPGADALGQGSQGIRIRHGRLGDLFSHPIGDAGVFDKRVITVGCDDKSPWHGKARLGQFRQIQPFPSNAGQGNLGVVQGSAQGKINGTIGTCTGSHGHPSQRESVDRHSTRRESGPNEKQRL